MTKLNRILVAVLAILFSCGEDERMAAPARPLITLGDEENVCLVGGALAERLQHDGWLESLVQTRYAGKSRLRFRNLGFGADEVAIYQRTAGFGSREEHLDRCRATLVLAFFGYNESFRGREGEQTFRRDLTEFVRRHTRPATNDLPPRRVVLFSPIPFEDVGLPGQSDAGEQNRRLSRYAAIVADVASATKTPFVDLMKPMARAYERAADPLTINGIHLTEAGDAVLATIIDEALFGRSPARDGESLARVREAVQRKNLLWFNRYRATDGYNVYGGRSALAYEDGVTNYTVLQRELVVLDALAQQCDSRIRALASGTTPPPLDPRALPPQIPVRTNKPGPGPGGAHVYLDGEAAIEKMTPAPDMDVNLFADEKRFPQLVNPVQMAWDARGRLWVAVWPTYPHWQPGQPMNDKLLIFEDVDGDGRADRCTSFADDLHNPTGFEFWNGGVLLAQAPDLVFLRDTDGDDRADVRERLLHGLSSADTHHTANSFVIGPDGALYFQEGIFHQTQIETIRGPVRNRDACVWRFDPRSFIVERYIPYGFANPHGHVFDRWGQDFVTDGTGNQNYYALPFSGYVPEPRKHGRYFPFFKQRSRPAAATEILSSSHFPPENQGNYLICNVIGFRGIFQYELFDDGAGFGAREVAPIVESEDENFRPVDVEVGPDGAIYFLDWQNALIGHMQHHLRDPSRDHAHGRIYRVTSRGGEPTRVPSLDTLSVDELTELLRSPDDRVRYRVRIELGARPAGAVISAVRRFVSRLDPASAQYDHDRLEALWVLQAHDVCDRQLLDGLLESSDFRARAAATRAVRYLARHLDDPVTILRRMVDDSAPRVRLAAVVGASAFGSEAAAAVVLRALEHPRDRFLDYAIEESLRALEAAWRQALTEGRLITTEPHGLTWLIEHCVPDDLIRLPRTETVLEAQLTLPGIDASARWRAVEELARLRGITADRVVASVADRLDRGRGSHAGHLLHELAAMTLKLRVAPSRDDCVRWTRTGATRALRALAWAWLATVHSEPIATLRQARRSGRSLADFLRAVPMLPEDLRGVLWPHLVALARESGGEMATDGPAGVSVAYYEPRPRDVALSTMRAVPAVAEGIAESVSIDVSIRRRDDDFALLFEGGLVVSQAGQYRFRLTSDDGSRLYLDEREVIENDGAHGMRAREGAATLNAGLHAIVVTYTDHGGDDGLRLEWSGPGFDWRAVTTADLRLDPSRGVKGAALRALASLPGHGNEKLELGAATLERGQAVEAATALCLEAASAADTAPEAVEPAVAAMLAHLESLPDPARRGAGALVVADALGRLAARLSEPRRRTVRERLVDLVGSFLVLRTKPHQMLYDRKEIWVRAGRPVVLVFQNDDVMPHNLVITRPGAMERVGKLAESASPRTPMDYVPKTDDVLWACRLLQPGESARISFTAPEEPVDLPYVCTFPGHWRVMNGTLHVVASLPEEAMTTPSSEQPSHQTMTMAPRRRFQRLWTVDDFRPWLVPGWRRGRSLLRGERLFAETGCIQCHGEEPVRQGLAPDVSTFTAKYSSPVELLRQIIEPSETVVEGYENILVVTKDGRQHTGRIVDERDGGLTLMPNLLEPEQVVRLEPGDVVRRRQLSLSPMPTGLLVTLSRNEILDLLAFLSATSIH